MCLIPQETQDKHKTAKGCKHGGHLLDHEDASGPLPSTRSLVWGQEPHAQRFPLRNQGPQQAQHARNSKSSPQGSLFRSAWRKSPLPPLDQALVVKLTVSSRNDGRAELPKSWVFSKCLPRPPVSETPGCRYPSLPQLNPESSVVLEHQHFHRRRNWHSI